MTRAGACRLTGATGLEPAAVRRDRAEFIGGRLTGRTIDGLLRLRPTRGPAVHRACAPIVIHTSSTKTGEEEMYNRARDSYQLDNVAADPGYAQVKAALAAKLPRHDGSDE